MRCDFSLRPGPGLGWDLPETPCPTCLLYCHCHIVLFLDDPETARIQMAVLTLVLQRKNPNSISPCKAPKCDFRIICGCELSTRLQDVAVTKLLDLCPQDQWLLLGSRSAHSLAGQPSHFAYPQTETQRGEQLAWGPTAGTERGAGPPGVGGLGWHSLHDGWGL